MGYEEAITIGLGICSFIWIYLSTKISGGTTIVIRNKEMNLEIFQPLFIIMGLFFMAFNLNVMMTLATNNSQTAIHDTVRIGYIAIIYPLIPFMIFYFVVSFLYNFFRNVKENTKDRFKK